LINTYPVPINIYMNNLSFKEWNKIQLENWEQHGKLIPEVNEKGESFIGYDGVALVLEGKYIPVYGTFNANTHEELVEMGLVSETSQ